MSERKRRILRRRRRELWGHAIIGVGLLALGVTYLCVVEIWQEFIPAGLFILAGLCKAVQFQAACCIYGYERRQNYSDHETTDLRVMAAQDVCSDGWQLYIRDYDRQAKQFHCYTEEGKVLVGANEPMLPVVTLTRGMAQALFDNLWRGGIRPTEQARKETIDGTA